MHQFPPPVYDVISAQCPPLRKPYTFGSKHTSSRKNPHSMPCLACLHLGLYRVTVPCHHLLFRCLSGQHALMHTGTEGLETTYLLIWCQASNTTVLTLPHTCQDLVSQACLAAQPTSWPWSRCAGPTSGQGTGQCLYTESMSQMCCGACSWCGDSSGACVPCETDIASEQEPHGEDRGLELEASLHRVNSRCVR